jgi:hypothetical protein
MSAGIKRRTKATVLGLAVLGFIIGFIALLIVLLAQHAKYF